MLIKLQNFTLREFSKPFLVAEIGSNFNGSIELAEKMILSAKKCGADAVKFQSCNKDTILQNKIWKNSPSPIPEFKLKNQEEFENFIALDEDKIRHLSNFSKKNNILFSSTVFCKSDVDLLNELNVPFFKIASMDLNHHLLIDYISKKKKPIFISCGFGEEHEIKDALDIIKSNNNNVVLLYCVSMYPPKFENVNLNQIDYMRKKFKVQIGFSDHSLGILLSTAACAKGVSVIEKHFTLDKNLPGLDHTISADPKDLSELSSNIKNLSNSLKEFAVKVTPQEMLNKNKMRRSIVASKDLKSGKIIELTDIDFKRFGDGIPPSEFNKLVGKKIKRNLKYDEQFKIEDFE